MTGSEVGRGGGAFSGMALAPGKWSGVWGYGARLADGVHLSSRFLSARGVVSWGVDRGRRSDG